MLDTRLRLFRLFGIPFYLDLSWIIILLLLSWTLANEFSTKVPGLERGNYWAMGFITALTFFVCIVLHEMGHALVARAYGMPVQGITLFLFGGVAELGGEPPSAGKEFLMAVAGPLVSLVLVLLLGGLALLGMMTGLDQALVTVLTTLASINFFVMVLNLVPAFPLDGGRVLRSILWAVTGRLRRATRVASWMGQAFAWLLIGLGLLSIFAGDWIGGLWLGLIGLFLNNAAKMGYQDVLIRQALQGEPIRRFMNPEPIVVPPSLDLRQWVEDFVYRYHRKSFPVASNGHLEGFVTTRDLNRIPRTEWDQHTVAEVMHPDIQAVSISADADALEALRKMQQSTSSRLLVTEGDRLVGIVSLKDLLRFLQFKLGLEEEEEEPANV